MQQASRSSLFDVIPAVVLPIFIIAMIVFACVTLDFQVINYAMLSGIAASAYGYFVTSRIHRTLQRSAKRTLLATLLVLYVVVFFVSILGLILAWNFLMSIPFLQVTF